MRHFLIALLLFSVVIPCRSQNDPVPGYLTTQNFPDSVKNVPIVRFDGTKGIIADILESHKGKKVVVDIWASWCRDCIVGLPKLEALKKKTGEENVVYIMLSVDKDDVKWRSAIDRFNIPGEHYRVEGAWKTALSNYIVLDWVPRYIVLNEDGLIIMPKAIHADDKAVEKVLLQTF